jgi:SAM-dependent methyltransferase
MHSSARAFVTQALDAAEVAGKRVLEVGAYDVNGSVRGDLERLEPASYLGTDITDGPGVDVVVDAERLKARFGADTFDVVVSTEVLEHVERWQPCLRNMLHVLRPGGLLVLTTRSPGMPYHAYPDDYWRFAVDTMDAIIRVARFELLTLESDPSINHPGVFVKARKPVGWAWPGRRTWAGITVGRVSPPGGGKGATMQQAIEPMWFTDERGIDVFIPKGHVLQDNHPHVKRMAAHFVPFAGDPAEETPAPPPAKPEPKAEAKAEAKPEPKPAPAPASSKATGKAKA